MKIYVGHSCICGCSDEDRDSLPKTTVRITFNDEETARKFVDLWENNPFGTQMMKLRGNNK